MRLTTQVRARLEEAKQRKASSSGDGDYAPDGFEALAAKEKARQEDERSKRRRGESDEEEEEEQEEGMDPAMAEMMGFGTFGTTKK